MLSTTILSSLGPPEIQISDLRLILTSGGGVGGGGAGGRRPTYPPFSPYFSTLHQI